MRLYDETHGHERLVGNNIQLGKDALIKQHNLGRQTGKRSSPN